MTTEQWQFCELFMALVVFLLAASMVRGWFR